MDLLNIFLIVTSVCAFIYTIQLVYLDKIRPQGGTVAEATSRKRARFLRAGPVVCSTLATIALILVPILGKQEFEACSQRHHEINPDVGGIGVLLGLFLPCLVLLMVLFLGHFTAHTSGAKELCMAQFANLLYLTINLLKGMKGLNPQELVIALSSIDAVSASISMAFSDKDVLAARTLVGFGFLTQIAAYGVQAAAFREYMQRDKLQSYWIYFSFRIMASMLPLQVAHRLTSSLNKIENRNNATRSTRVKATALWGFLPATLATSYMIFWPFILLHGLSIFNILRGTNTIDQSWHSLTSEWGQSANAIIAVFAICHVTYAVHRLFVADNTIDGAQTSQLSGRSVSRAYPQMAWLAWKHWPWTKPRWPFHLGLDYSDHLLVDESTLERVLNPPLELDPIVRMKLWQDLMDGFTYNDPDGIIDCLDQGAPLDERNDDGDYPIHLAARHNNTDILMRTRSSFTKDSVGSDPLLFQNLANETPLEVACNANTLEAVRWIMERLPQTHTDAEDAVRRAFKIAILGEKVGTLKILQHLWPGWKALGIQSQSDKFSLLCFAIKERKAKSSYWLTKHKGSERKRPNARRIFELCWKSEIAGRCVEIIMGDCPDNSSCYHDHLIDNVIKSRSVDNTEALELLLALNIDIFAVFRRSIQYSIGPGISHDERHSMWEYILQEGYTLEPKGLDSIITFELNLALRGEGEGSLVLEINDTTNPWYEPNDRMRKHEKRKDRITCEGLIDRIRKALVYHGGRDWSEVARASTFTSTSKLKELIIAEGDQTMLLRMLSIGNNRGCSLLTYTISRDLDGIDTGRDEYTEILLENGIQVGKLDLTYAHKRGYFEDGNIAKFMLSAAYAKTGVTSEMLHTMCSNKTLSAWEYMHLQVLLRCGANPILTDKNGRTPRNALRHMQNMAAKEHGDEPDIQRPDAPGKRRKVRPTQVSFVPKVMDLLQRWEDYYNDPCIGKPSERPDANWSALIDNIQYTTRMWLIDKNPEGYKVVEENKGKLKTYSEVYLPEQIVVSRV